MKKLEIVSMGLLAAVLMAGVVSAIVPIRANAGDITANGMYQGDLYTFLSNVVTNVNDLKDGSNTVLGSYSAVRTLTNESKTDHNTLLGSYSSLRADYVDLRAKYNTLFSKMSTLNYRAGHTGGFATVTGTQSQIMGNQRVAGSADSTVVTSARTTTATNSTVVSGARITDSDLSLTGL